MCTLPHPYPEIGQVFQSSRHISLIDIFPTEHDQYSLITIHVKTNNTTIYEVHVLVSTDSTHLVRFFDCLWKQSVLVYFDFSVQNFSRFFDIIGI